MIQIYNEDNSKTIERLKQDGKEVDIILTSPPYFTSRDNANSYTAERFDNFMNHYDVFEGYESEDDYIGSCVDLFTGFDGLLKKSGCVLWNVSYSAEWPVTIWRVINAIDKLTNFTVVDCIIWKKSCAIPANKNSNRATRICEFVFVFCYKGQEMQFYSNKVKVSNGQYTNLFTNFIEAVNNDGPSKRVNRVNSAVFSVDLCKQLFSMYAPKGAVVYDPFMGTGTTAVACKQMGFDCYGSEISEAQCKLANDRLSGDIIAKETGSQLLF